MPNSSTNFNQISPLHLCLYELFIFLIFIIIIIINYE